MKTCSTSTSSDCRRSYVGQLDSVDDTDPIAAPPLVCLIEDTKGGEGINQKVSVSVISITVSTGDVVWDYFEGV